MTSFCIPTGTAFSRPATLKNTVVVGSKRRAHEASHFDDSSFRTGLDRKSKIIGYYLTPMHQL